MSLFRPSGTRRFKSLWEASQKIPLQSVRLSPKAIQDKNTVEAGATKTRRSAGPTKTSAAGAGTTSAKGEKLVLRPSISGAFGPREQRRAPPAPPPALAGAGSSNGRAPRAHLPRVNALERARAPHKPAVTSAAAVPLAEVQRKGWRFDRKKGAWVEGKKARKARVKAEKRALDEEKVRIAKRTKREQPALPTVVQTLKLDLPTFAPRAASVPTDLESALFALPPSSRSSVRLPVSRPLPRALFARRFQAERDAALAEQALRTYPRGAGSVDLGGEGRSSAAGRRARLASRSRRAMADVGLKLRIDATGPLDGLEERVVAATPRKTQVPQAVKPVVEAVKPVVETVKVVEPVARAAKHVEVAVEKIIAKIKADKVVAEGKVEVKPAFTPSTAISTSLLSSSAPTARPPAPPRPPRFLSSISPWALDPRESTYPAFFRGHIPSSPLERRLGLLAQRIWADLDASSSERASSPYAHAPASAAEHALRVAATAERRATRLLEDRCLEGELARAEEQRQGRRALALQRVAGALEPLVEAYRAYRSVGAYVPVAERALLERVRRAEGLLQRALPPAWEEHPDEGEALLWAGDAHFLVPWDAYIAAYRYGASRRPKELVALVRRREKKVELLADELHMLVWANRSA
ncbi:hypothetical protein JCM10450v2_003999 [Rhodotorula kratochvilovae]